MNFKRDKVPQAVPDKELLLRCDCAGHCAIVGLDLHDLYDDTSYSAWAEFYRSYTFNPWRERVKTAWRVLRGKDALLDALVFYPPQLRTLRDFLTENLEDQDGFRDLPSTQGQQRESAPSNQVEPGGREGEERKA